MFGQLTFSRHYLMNTQGESQSMPVVIMCGGKGTRLREETEYKPKPMVEIGGYPILWHIMKIYAHYGYTNFILCLGYRGTAIKEYFLNHHLYTKDFQLNLSENSHQVLNPDSTEKFKITFADTGEDTLTAERLLKVEKYLHGDAFMLTYGDGVSNIDLDALREHHEKQHHAHGTIGTITGIHPKSKYGLVEMNEHNIITKFQEKPQLSDYTNGGFMVLTKAFLPYCKPGEMVEESLIKACADGKISLYEHEGFWHSMDTYKDKEDLEKLWNSTPHWKIWN